MSSTNYYNVKDDFQILNQLLNYAGLLSKALYTDLLSKALYKKGLLSKALYDNAISLPENLPISQVALSFQSYSFDGSYRFEQLDRLGLIDRFDQIDRSERLSSDHY